MIDFDINPDYPLPFSDIDIYVNGYSEYHSHQTSKRSVIDTPKKANPYYFNVIQSRQVGSFLAVQIKYPTCTNYEGIKILVFEGIDAETLSTHKNINPYFSENEKELHLIARFAPTSEGWANSLKFCEMLNSEQLSYSF